MNSNLSSEERAKIVDEQNLRIMEQREARGESYELSPPLK